MCIFNEQQQKEAVELQKTFLQFANSLILCRYECIVFQSKIFTVVKKIIRFWVRMEYKLDCGVVVN